GTQIGKEFNPQNPPLGSTVIATFVWVGSSNIIDSVADYLWTGKRPGNVYTLVEYVTAGGLSMATYVATNVQNFPSPKTVSGDELVVNAYLRTPVSAGGALVSAFTGVNPVFPQALGAHRSATGSGSTTPTYAHPGAITVGAGALVYGVSMVSDGLAARLRPPGFTWITTCGTNSPSMQFDAQYAVQAAAGSVDPQWGWSFSSPTTWLASSLALNPAGGTANQPPVAAFTPTCNGLSCTFTSTSSDADGTIATYNWSLGDGASATAQNPSRTYAAAGTYTVTLTVTDDQGAASAQASQDVTVGSTNQPPVANFAFTCSALTCNFTSTSSDADGTIAAYNWNFGDGTSSTSQDPSRTYAAAGTYTVTLTVTDNLAAADTTARSVGASVPNQPPVASFTFNCPTGGLTCNFTSTSSDPDGTISAYSWAFGDGDTSALPNPSRTYAAAGSYSVRLIVTDDGGVRDTASTSVTVSQASTATHLAFTVQPSTTTAGSTISPAVVVAAQDGGGSTDASFSGTISIALGANLSGGLLAGTRSVSAVNGVATFSNLSIDRAGSGYTLQATATGLTGAASAPFNITAPSNGIAYSADVGTLSQRNLDVLIKGFNGLHPHHGDAIVATFFWFGPPDIITSVTDVITMPGFPLVGNTYHLVDQVSAGGISMATYVATNVQNFPDPPTDPSVVLAVRATLSQTVVDGGVALHAWSGVATDFAAALGQARSASGASANDTSVGPGSITVNGGALALAVTMASAPTNRIFPSGFSQFAGSVMIDDFMAVETDYKLVPSTSTVDPRWLWFFSSQGGTSTTWLATVFALNRPP
ncbi:MAG TPA: PKD domain-containing protein, partial [Gemmatimonadales bacterium]|nr:PKD domain-containing protein [Gemmatimonadales bacterium]